MIQTWYPQNGTLVRRGHTPGVDRDSLVIGTYTPDSTTTGVIPGTTLTRSDGNMTITTNGTTLENLDIYGIVTVNAADVTIRNCRIRGDTNTATGDCITCYGTGVQRLLVEDCTLIRDTPNEKSTGLVGHDFTARRLDISHTVDGLGAFNTNAPSSPVNVTIEGCYVHDFSYFWPCTYQSDNQTHNDCFQIQGGSNISIVGNNLQAFIDPSVGLGAGDPSNPIGGSLAHMTGVIITPNVGAVADITMNQNWLAGGSAEINISEKSYGPIQGLSITNNRFFRTPNYTILIPDTTKAVATITNNVWNDDGTAIPIYKGA